MIAARSPALMGVFPESAASGEQLAQPAHSLDDAIKARQHGHAQLLPRFKRLAVIREGARLKEVPRHAQRRGIGQWQRGVCVNGQLTGLGDQVGQITGALRLRGRRQREIGPGFGARPPGLARKPHPGHQS